MRVHLIRHAEPEDAAGMCYGSSDLHVAPARQRDLLARLASVLPRGIRIVTSPLQRCHALAQPLAAALHAPAPLVDGRLREMCFGAWEMRSWSAIPRAEVDAWNSDLLHYRPGGGECVLEVAQRVQAFYDQLCRAGQGDAAVVCHAGIIRLLTRCRPGADVATIAMEAARTPHRIGYGEITTLDLDVA